MLTYLPKKLANKAVICYLFSLLAVTVLFMSSAMPVYLYIFGIVTVLAFFYGSSSLSQKWHNVPVKEFSNKLFFYALLIRLVYVIFIYFFNQYLYDSHLESNHGDIGFYMDSGLDIAERIRHGQWDFLKVYRSWGIPVDDMGYNIYLAFVYLLSGSASDIFIPLMLKALWGALTCLAIYKIAQRHFGERTARMSGIFCMLQFNMIWWCGSMMKETEMVLLTVLAVERIDKILFTKYFTASDVIIAILASASLLTLRTVLTILIITAFAAAIFFGNGKITSTPKKIFAGIVIAILLTSSIGANLIEQTKEISKTAGGSYQKTNMEWRARREGGNTFAQYAKASVFAPLIFTLPFPSMVYTFQGQEMQMQVNGGNFIKNILSYFVILALLSLLFNGKWREHAFPIMFLCGYLIALVLSVFAQSGRYHMPAIPFEMMFAAYGISLLNKKSYKYFKWALVLEFVICIGWAYYKLAGRGLV